MLDYQKNSFNADIYLSYSWRYKYNQIERRHEELRHQRQFFQNLDNFHIYVSFVNGKNVLLFLNILYQSFTAIVIKTASFSTFIG